MMTRNFFVMGPMAAATLFLACSSGSSDGGGKDSGAASSGMDAGDHTFDADARDTGSAARHDSSASTNDAGPVAATWTFHGGEASVSLKAGTKPGVVTIAAGGDVSAAVTVEFAAPTASGALTLSTAENGCCGVTGGDVTPSTLPTDDAEDLSASAAPGTMGDPTLYLSFYNTGSSAISFATTPALTITPTDGGLLADYIPAMDECQLDLYLRDASGKLTWTAIPSAVMMLDPEATVVSIPSASLPDGGVFDMEPGQLVGGITCD